MKLGGENPPGICLNWPGNIQSRSVSAAVKIRATYGTKVDNGAMRDGRGQLGDGRLITIAPPSSAVAEADPPKDEPRKTQNMLQPASATRDTSKPTAR